MYNGKNVKKNNFNSFLNSSERLVKGFHLAMYSAANEAAKINRRQARRVYEILRYRCTPKVKNNKKIFFLFFIDRNKWEWSHTNNIPALFFGKEGMNFSPFAVFQACSPAATFFHGPLQL